MPTIAKYKHHSSGLRFGTLTTRYKTLFKIPPCRTCGKPMMAERKRIKTKQFCRLQCYIESRTLIRRIKEKNLKVTNAMRAKLPRGHQVSPPNVCVKCGKEFWKKHGKRTKFCNEICQRLYFSERFDRWIESPKTISLPQNYDEFLTQDKLRCVVEGCTFEGHHLAHHVNRVHGVSKTDLKTIMGFNQTSAIISMPLKLRMQKRKGVGFTKEARKVAEFEVSLKRKSLQLASSGMPQREIKQRILDLRNKWMADNGILAVNKVLVASMIRGMESLENRRSRKKGRCAVRGMVTRRVSLEEAEHVTKGRCLKRVEAGNLRCLECAHAITNGGFKYCSIRCARLHCNKRFTATKRKIPLVCSNCRRDFLGTAKQQLRLKDGFAILCSQYCRGAHNIKIALQARCARKKKTV